MKIINKTFLVVLLSFYVLVANASQEKELTEVLRNVRCLTCNAQSIEESNSAFAKNLRKKIADKIHRHVPKEEIYRSLKEEYGEGIFFSIPHKGLNWVVIISFVFIFLILFFLYKKHFLRGKKIF